MTLEEAKAESQRRWRVWGGWAEEQYIEDSVSRVVGIRTNDGQGSRRVQLGRGKTWDKAFQSAERRIEQLKERRRAEKKPEAGYPTVEMFPELDA